MLSKTINELQHLFLEIKPKTPFEWKFEGLRLWDSSSETVTFLQQTDIPHLVASLWVNLLV
jgi:hypothetical protein